MSKLIWIFDGFTSSSMLINYLRHVFPDVNITWSNHVRMKHGIDLELIPESTNLLIVPDAGSNNYKEHKQLKGKGIDVLILDHHEASHYSEDALVINIQLDDYPNKQISGAGVVYKLLQKLDRELNIRHSEEYRDVLALGLIGDAMSLSNKETFWLVKDGLSNIKSELVEELIKENVKDESLTPKSVSFKINPKINSLLRVGTIEELDDLMKAFLNHQEITINNRLRSTDKTETWARRMTRTCNNTYARQRRLRDKIMEEIEEKIERDNLNDNQFITIEVEGEFAPNMSGYVAIALVQKYRKPCIILRRNSKGVLIGSLRGYDPLMTDTKDFLKNLNLFTLAEGHQNACGLEIGSTNFSLLDEVINHKLSDVEVEESYIVDFVMNQKAMTSSFIEDMDKYAHLWGKGIEEPQYAIVDIDVRGTDLQLIGKTQNVIKFMKNNIEYVQFTASEELKEYVGSDKKLTLTIIGTTGINVWLDKRTPQFVIEAVRIDKAEQSFGFEF